MPELDKKAARVFAGRVVRKDLVRKAKVGASVPVFVLEYLLGKYCATDDPVAISAGMQLVEKSIVENCVRPDESNKIQAFVKEKGHHTLIDKVKVKYHSSEDKYWAEMVNFGHRQVHIPQQYVLKYDRLLMGGVWAKVLVRHQYDEEAKGRRSPFWIDELTPIQIASFDLDDFRGCRSEFTSEEWIDLLTRSIGLEPSFFSRRTKLIMLLRLIPFCEKNYNLVELGPRGTGKSYCYQELTPYAILLTGPTTVANLFYNISRNSIGLVGIWDAIAFDEVADLKKMPKEVVSTLKTYCESGTFARGREALSGTASIALFGNTNQPVEVMVSSSHLFLPMPDVIREDMAFLDRIHCYIPGWEIPKMSPEFFSDHYGFVIDYLSEALRELRKCNFTETIDEFFSLGSHLNARDVKAVRRSVSGLMKLIYPDKNCSKEEITELLELALECRRRVKEQLKKMGSYEYSRTSFSYIDRENLEEHYVGVPEEGGRDLVSTDPLAWGSCYAIDINKEGKVGLYRFEVGISTGTGKLKLSGKSDSKTREAVKRAFDFIKTRKGHFAIAQAFDASDFHVETIDLLGNGVSCESGVALIVAILSALKKQAVQPGLVVLGDVSIQGNIKQLFSLNEPLQVAMDNGAKRALVPIANKRHFLDVPPDIIEKVDPIFFGDAMTAAMKAMGLK